MPNMIFIFTAALVVVLFVLRLLRQRVLGEKYAALWVVVGSAVVALVAFPELLTWVARLLGFELGSNLLFALALVLLLGVALHLSLEISRLEDETRVLAEELGIQRLQMERLSRAVVDASSGSAGRDPVENGVAVTDDGVETR